MKKQAKIATLKAGAAPLVMGLALLSTHAYAQTADPQAQPAPTIAGQPAPAEPGADIVVTGSRIPQPNLESVSPITVVSSQDIKLQGTTRVEDLLNALPSVSASQGSTVANGADGTATVDLRGLGTTRTLALVNGRRLLPGDPSPTSGSAADINIIPASLLKRVEVLTGGASSTYGADAVAGVVNFIIDTDFTGVRIDGLYSFFQHNNRDKFLTPLLNARANAGLSGYGYPKGSVADGGTVDATVSIGSKFADDKGHALVYFGYRKVNPVLQANRDYSACVLQNTGAGVAELRRLRYFGQRQRDRVRRSAGHRCDIDDLYVRAEWRVQQFDQPLQLRAANYYQRPDERYTAGLFANYEVNDSIKPYLEFMFMDDRTVAQIAPSGDFGNTLTINSDNPLISPAQRAIIFDGRKPDQRLPRDLPYGGRRALQSDSGGRARSTSSIRSTGVTYKKAFFQLLRRNVEGGPRQADLQHTNFRAVIGSKGDLDKAWSYDAYYQYGRSNYHAGLFERFFGRAADPGARCRRRGPGGTPICRSVRDGTDPTCVPYNVFGGAGAASAASVAYLSTTGFQKGQTSEQVANISFTGLLGEYGVRTPWAEDGVGRERRRASGARNRWNSRRTSHSRRATSPVRGAPRFRSRATSASMISSAKRRSRSCTTTSSTICRLTPVIAGPCTRRAPIAAMIPTRTNSVSNSRRSGTFASVAPTTERSGHRTSRNCSRPIPWL